MGKQDNIIGGYLFLNREDASKAKKEMATINKIKETIDVNDSKKLLDLYNKLVYKNVFFTPVGIGFLHELRDYLAQFNNEEELAPIAIRHLSGERKNISAEFNMDKYDKLKKENELLKKAKQKLVIAIVAMAVAIIGMIFIVITNDNLGYFNAEDKVLNKYSAWEERLSNWEDELIKREELLNQ